MEFRVLEGMLSNENWKSMQLLKEGHDKIYNRDQITIDFDCIMINTNNSLLIYDVKSIKGIQLFYVSVEELLEQLQENVNEQGE